MILTITSSTLPSTTFPIPKNKVAKHTKDAETKEIGLRTFRGFIIASERKTEDMLRCCKLNVFLIIKHKMIEQIDSDQ